jgi:septal ring factor EnvC (AmiA/AmiB activator)
LIFDLKTAERIARRYLWPTVVAFLVFCPLFSGAFIYVWHWERDLNQREQKMNHELNERERELNSRDISEQKRELTIEQREAILKQREANLAEQAATITRSQTDGSKKLAGLQALQVQLSRESRIAKADDQIQQLIREFAATGVDLEHAPYCDDAAAVKQHEHAKAIYESVLGLAVANGLYPKYQSFLNEVAGPSGCSARYIRVK